MRRCRYCRGRSFHRKPLTIHWAGWRIILPRRACRWCKGTGKELR